MRNLLASLTLVLMLLGGIVFAQNPAPVKSPPFALSEDYPYEDVEVMMPDTVLIHGRLYDPSQLLAKPVAASGEESDEEAIVDDPEPENVTKYPLVILVHGLNGTKQDWGNLPEVLVKKGYAVIALDLRGHGESDRNIKGRKISWRTFKGKQWEELPRDVERVVRYLRQEQEFPQIDTSRVALVGAKMGGNVTIIAASRMPEVKAMVIMSAGVNYKGLDTSRAIVSYKKPIFVVASQQDVYSYESSELLYRWSTGVKKLQLYKQIGDGTEMLRHLPSLKSEIASWLAGQLPPTPVLPKPKPAAAPAAKKQP